MSRRPLESRLAWFSLAAAGVHLCFETAYHLRFGQFLPMLVVDYIAVALVALGSWVSLRSRPAPAAGLLCGGWGFTFCLAYRSFFWRVEDYLQQAGRRGEEPDALLCVLGCFLLVSAIAFLLSVRLVLPPRRPRRAAGPRAALLLLTVAGPALGQCPPQMEGRACAPRELAEAQDDVLVLATVLAAEIADVDHERVRGFCVQLGGKTPEPRLLRAVAAQLAELGDARVAGMLHPSPDCTDRSPARPESSHGWADWPKVNVALTARACGDRLVVDGDHSTGTVGGEWRTHTLAREDGRWQVVETCTRWMS